MRPQETRILLVEDEVVIRMALAEGLRAAGFSVIEAASADEALAYLSAGAQVDLVFSDIQMPGSLDGLDLARRLRRQRPALPVILTSGDTVPEEAAGFRIFLPKPYSAAVAVEAVNESLGPKGGADAAKMLAAALHPAV